MISLPCFGGFVKTRPSISQCKANARNFIKEIRNSNKRTSNNEFAVYEYSTDVICAECQTNTLVPSDIQSIEKFGLCRSCCLLEPENITFVRGK